jgi:hypothetical protein
LQQKGCNGRGGNADNGHAHPKRGAAAKKSLIQEADQEGPETCSKQGHAAIGDGHRLSSRAVGHCQLNGNEHQRENRSGDADGGAIQTHSNAGPRCEGDWRQVRDLNEADAAEQQHDPRSDMGVSRRKNSCDPIALSELGDDFPPDLFFLLTHSNEADLEFQSERAYRAVK